jgi:hypothetical protein
MECLKSASEALVTKTLSFIRVILSKSSYIYMFFQKLHFRCSILFDLFSQVNKLKNVEK